MNNFNSHGLRAYQKKKVTYQFNRQIHFTKQIQSLIHLPEREPEREPDFKIDLNLWDLERNTHSMKTMHRAI